MSISTYALLKTAVKDWLKRGTELDSYIDNIIQMGELWIYRNVNVRGLEATLSSTIASGVIAVPTDYMSLKFAYVSSTSPYQWLERKTASDIYITYPSRSSSGLPKFIAREGSNFIFGPYPDSTYTITGIYYRTFDYLSNSVNGFFTSNPDLYLFSALAETAVFLKDDPRLPMWISKRNSIRDDIQKEDSNEGVSGGPLTMRPS